MFASNFCLDFLIKYIPSFWNNCLRNGEPSKVINYIWRTLYIIKFSWRVMKNCIVPAIILEFILFLRHFLYFKSWINKWCLCISSETWIHLKYKKPRWFSMEARILFPITPISHAYMWTLRLLHSLVCHLKGSIFK